jgi:hypothetical protein
MFILVILAYIAIIFFDLIGLYKKNIKKDFYIASIICLISFAFALLLSFDIKIPSPSKPIENFIKYLFKWIK